MVTTPHPENASGVSTIELVLVIPLILALFLGIIDFARYTTARGVLQSSAQQAVSLASVIPDLDLEGQIYALDSQGNVSSIAEGEVDGSLHSRQLAALQQVSAKINKVLNAGGIKVGGSGTHLSTFKIVLPESGQPLLVDRLTETPIHIEMEGEFKPLLGLIPPIKLRIKAAAFREQRKTSTMPLAADCNGEVGGSNQNCPCPSNPGDSRYVWDPSARECTCRQNVGLTGDASSCNCGGENRVWDPVTKSCACGPCPSGKGVQSGSCTCVCQNGYVEGEGGSCSCPPPRTEENGTCSCLPGQRLCNSQCVDDCPTGSWSTINHFDSVTCSCKCNQAGFDVTCNDGSCKYKNCNGAGTPLPLDPVTCSCNCPSGFESCQFSPSYVICMPPCPNGSSRASNEYCQCKCESPSEAPCAGGCQVPPTCGANESLDLNTCTCQCNWPAQRCNGACVMCPEDGTITDPATCACGCASGATCDYDPSDAAAGQYCYLQEWCQNGSSPTCDQGCVCDDPSKEYCWALGCTAPCPAGSTRNTSTCACACPSGKSMCNGTCVSCGGGVVDLETCECGCPPPQQLCNGTCRSCVGGTLAQDCSCQCPVGQSYCNGGCNTVTCNGGTVSGSCGCTCPSGTTLCNGSCIANCTNGRTLNPASCACECSGTSCDNGSCKTCPAGQSVDTASCSCACPQGQTLCSNGSCGNITCPGGQVFDPQSCACGCPSVNQALCNGSCIDTTTQCTAYPNSIFNPVSCSCVCDTGYQQYGGGALDCRSPVPPGCSGIKCSWDGSDWIVTE